MLKFTRLLFCVVGFFNSFFLSLSLFPAFNCFNLFYARFDAQHYLVLMKEFQSAVK